MRSAAAVLLLIGTSGLVPAQEPPRHPQGVSSIPRLEQAYRRDPLDYANAYNLALAYLEAGDTVHSRQVLAALLRREDKGELHNLLADVEEAEGHIDEAARQYEIAARLDPSEKNLFDLGSDLDLHHGFEPALKVFEFAVQRYPRSARLRVGLGVAHYSLGQYDAAVEALCQAVDLDPADTKALDFLGKMYDVSPQFAGEVTQRLARFVRIYPRNAAAQYYYAMSLRKRALPADAAGAEQFLLRAVALQPDFADAHYELGLLYEERSRNTEAVREYESATRLRADFAKAHYHLARLYRKAGREAQARKEFQAFEALQGKAGSPAP